MKIPPAAESRCGWLQVSQGALQFARGGRYPLPVGLEQPWIVLRERSLDEHRDLVLGRLVV